MAEKDRRIESLVQELAAEKTQFAQFKAMIAGEAMKDLPVEASQEAIIGRMHVLLSLLPKR